MITFGEANRGLHCSSLYCLCNISANRRLPSNKSLNKKKKSEKHERLSEMTLDVMLHWEF